ncbi:MAG TPA: 5-formyltetrahydrofolate cyclo-ligase [Verrucomicrobiota bacterium]|nr:5-formyltetrahydrofolate cyclo-ligase [Verrucomicrobiota bacterium]HNU51674.1 5-formyltetrahydrofolate cyclo-ligase [Verrucomicrobiota bacterium]
MDQSLDSAKAALRTELTARLEAVPAQTRTEASTAACRLLVARDEWRTARAILFYAAMRDELDLWPVIREAWSQDRTVALPRYQPACRAYEAACVGGPADLRTGWYGILEPGPQCASIPVNRLDLVLVPGLAFDPVGGRLGRGKGHYDRLLADARGWLCGVAMDEQVVLSVPTGPQDVLLNCILTPTRWIACRQRSV